MTLDELIELRKVNYRQAESTQVRSEADGLDFINDLGFLWLIDLSDADLPSLQRATPESFGPNIAWVFRWNRKEVAGLVQELVQCDEIREIEVLGIPGPMYATPTP